MVTDVRRRVLVAEDDDAIRTMLRVLLVRSGFGVECVSDGATAIRMVEGNAYDVLVLDLILPELNGFGLLEQLARERPAMLPRTIITTGVGERHLARIAAHPVFGVFRKPFDISALLTAISTCAHRVAEAQAGLGRDDHPEERPQFASSAGDLRRGLSGPGLKAVELLPQTGYRAESSFRRPRAAFHTYLTERFVTDRSPATERSASLSYSEPEDK